MGRCITGDVEDKCWFGLQSSDFMDRFGVSYSEPAYISYYYTTDDLPDLQKELCNIKTTLGDSFQEIEYFFEANTGWNKDMLKNAGITEFDLKEYADYKFAEKVEACIIEHGDCSFDVEL